MTMIFDTLEISEKLKSAKFTKVQSDTLVDIIRNQNEQVLTRPDLDAAMKDLRSEMKDLRTELKTEIDAVRTELKSDIADVRYNIERLEHRMTIKLGGIMIAGIGFLTVLDRLWPVGG